MISIFDAHLIIQLWSDYRTVLILLFSCYVEGMCRHFGQCTPSLSCGELDDSHHSHVCPFSMKLQPAAGYLSLAQRLEVVGGRGCLARQEQSPPAVFNVLVSWKADLVTFQLSQMVFMLS